MSSNLQARQTLISYHHRQSSLFWSLIQVEPCETYSLVSDFLHKACFWDSSVLSSWLSITFHCSEVLHHVVIPNMFVYFSVDRLLGYFQFWLVWVKLQKFWVQVFAHYFSLGNAWN
jgi:hypothetical protein